MLAVSFHFLNRAARILVEIAERKKKSERWLTFALFFIFESVFENGLIETT